MQNRVAKLIESKVSLAPMAGITDYVLRSLVRKHAPTALLTTEMISSEFLAQNVKTEITKLDDTHHPIVYQINGHKPHLMEAAARYLSQFADMIDINIRAVHILTKSFLKDMEKRDSGYILNVASSAAFQPGPLMATYYATKSYVYQLTEAIYYEQKKKKSNVHVSVLCPGPVATNFNNVANVNFAVKPLTSEYVARYAIDNMFKEKMLIIPGFKMKCAKFFGRFVSDKFLLRMAYRIQRRKVK